MRLSAKADYAVRAAIELAATPDQWVKTELLAEAQAIPRTFLQNILQEMRRAALVESRRGPDGGHRLARPASEISLADVIRAVDGPLANVGGAFPEDASTPGRAAALGDVWIAARSALREVLEQVSLADVASGELPGVVARLAELPGARARR